MAEGLARKKRIRAGHKASATKTIGKVEELLSSGDVVDNSKFSQLKLSLEEKLETVKRLDIEILDLIEDAKVVEEIEQADSFKDSIFAAIVRIEKVLTTTPPAPPTAPPVAPRASETSADGGGHRVKLPKLTLKAFNGDITTWTSFWDSFESAIHKNSSLSDIDKFNYLNSLLEHSAREAVSGLTLTSANYHEAVSVLKKRFGNKQQIISRHMEILLNVEPVTSQHNLKGLRHLFDLIESHVRSLKSLGVSSDSYGALLSSVLLSKLPHELRLIVSRETSDDDWNMDNLMRKMEQEIEARERAQANPANPNIATTNQPSRKPNREHHTAAALLSGASDPPRCCYCQQAHSSGTCKNVTQVDARKQILRKSGRCFSCLRRGHLSRECRSKSKCAKCGGRHHFSICSQSSSPAPIRSSDPPPPSATTVHSVPATASQPSPSLNPNAASFVATPTTTMYIGADKTVLLQTARALVYNPATPQSPQEIRMVLDAGSQRSYVTNRIKNALALKPEGDQLMSIITFGSDQCGSQKCEIVRICMRLKDGPDKEFRLFAIPLICEPIAAQPIALCREHYGHLSQLDLADFSDGTTPMGIDMLIGADYYWELTTGKTSRGDSGPVAIHTRLGWVLSGPAPATESTCQSLSLMTTHTLHVGNPPSDADGLDATLQSFWDLESLGIKDPDRSIFTDFEQSVKFRDGRYEVKLPWKDPHPVLPDNYQLCLKRLHGLLRRLQQDPLLFQQYDSIIRDQIQQGVVQPVQHPDVTEVGKVHYLPHHAVVRQDKETTKLRVVYDASAKSDGPSLNNCLCTGPKFDQRIMDILQRFRTHKVALAADIEKAFLMVSMSEADRDVLRFLWIDDILNNQPNVCVFRFTRVVFGVSSSPFLLNATIRHHLNKYTSSHLQLVKKLLQSTYVDDIVSGANNDDNAYLLYKESKGLLKAGGFNLRKFITNSSQLQDRINHEEGVSQPSPTSNLDETYTSSILGTTQKLHIGEQKILGVRWNVGSDHLVLDIGDIACLAKELEPTKRNIVSVVGRFYDPMGFMSPFVIRFKVLFQELCRAKLDWDKLLEGELLRRWQSLISDLQGSSPISIPRYFLSNICQEVKSCSLHGFCDASKEAYAAVVYLLIETPGEHYVRFVASKTRVAPVHEQTIPRLELLSALLLAKLLTSVATSLESELPLSLPTCYTDSKVALFWIVGLNREWKQFVQNRVSEIRRLLPPNCWKHVAGKDNPADLPSRGLALVELSVNKLWREGPDWLREKEAAECQGDIPMPEECISEMKAKSQGLTHSLLAAEEPSSLSKIIDCSQFSMIQRLFRVTAYVLKFTSILKQRVKSNNNMSSTSSTILSTAEISHAETLWIKEAQTTLVKDKKFASWKKQFNLFLDPIGLWRCGGRLSNAEVPYSTKHPILLPRNHYLSTLIVLRAHERVLHDGTKETLTEVRSKYWIVKGRSFVKSILRHCTLCHRYEGKAYTAPAPPPLPKFRVREEPPFTYTGVDFAGPLFVKSGSNENKVWLCRYTCCIIRAVHLDIVPDLTTESFIRSFKRFSARRGLPRRMISDNGKTFKAAAKSLEKMMNHEEVQLHLSGVGIEWSFNVEKAPWWGGIFERMVRSTKRCLKKIVGRAKLSYDELLTAITEVEMIINSRPLTYLSSDDVEEPLTPAHFLTGRRTLSVPDSLICESEGDDFTVTRECLTRRMRHLNVVLNQFWKRWQREYLLELREAHRYSSSGAKADAISIGEIVLVHDDKPRGFWKLARVEEVITGQDGNVRGAVVRVSSEKGRSTMLRRPLQRLYPLEIESGVEGEGTRDASEANGTGSLEGVDATDQEEDVVVAARSKRVAAIQARDQIKAWTTYENEHDV